MIKTGKMRKVFSLILGLSLVLTSVAQNSMVQAAKKSKKEKVRVTSVKIVNVGKKLRIQKGKKYRLKTSIKVKPNKSKYKKLKFVSSNRKIVLVNSRGLLRGKKVGTAKVTVASKMSPQKKASLSVTVTNDVLVSSIKLDRTQIVADEFNEQEIPLTVKKILPANAKNKEIEWTTSNENVADVDEDGVVTTGDVGTATITATAADRGGAFATCKVTVTENNEKEEEDTVTPSPVPQPQNPVISNTERPEESPSETTPVPQNPIVPVEKLSVSAVTELLAPGDCTYLKVSYMPADTIEKEVYWTASDRTVTVDINGKLTVGEDFAFAAGEEKKSVSVTAVSQSNPSVSGSILLTVFDPAKMRAPVLENQELDLSKDMATSWTLNGNYGVMTFTKENRVHFETDNSVNSDATPSVYNNGCAWYLEAQKSRTDVSDWKYIAVTIKTESYWDIKMMTWEGTDDAESYWDKKDTWGQWCGEIEHDDGSMTLIYRTDKLFRNAKQAKAVGITLKSADGEDDTVFVPKEAEIYGIAFTNTLPEGMEDTTEEEMPAGVLENPQVSLDENRLASWVGESEFGTVTGNEDGTVTFNAEKADQNNNRCAWYLAEDGAATDVSVYPYVSVRVSAEQPVHLVTWTSFHPDGMWDGKITRTPVTVLEHADGSKTIVYRTSSVFPNPAKARGIGIYIVKDSTEGTNEAKLSEIRFLTELPQPDGPKESNTPAPQKTTEPTAVPSEEYYFSDLYEAELSNQEISSVKDENGLLCAELKYKKTNGLVFLQLPYDIRLSDYESVSVTGNMPGPLIMRMLSASVNMEEDLWWDNYNNMENWYLSRSGNSILTETYDLVNAVNPDDPTRYITLTTSGTPYGGLFGKANYLLYSIRLKSKTEGIPDITLTSSGENLVAQSTPLPSRPANQVVTPADTVYEIPLTEENESVATKGKDEFRTDVQFYQDGSVSYTNTVIYNSGMVFHAAPDGKVADLSEYDYVEVELDGPPDDVSLSAFNDASSFWNKCERYAHAYDGRCRVRVSLQSFQEQTGLDLKEVDGFAIGYTSESSVGCPVRIYSIRVVKEVEVSVESGTVAYPADVCEVSLELSKGNEAAATKGDENRRTDVEFHEDGSVSFTSTNSNSTGMMFYARNSNPVELDDFDYVDIEFEGSGEIALCLTEKASVFGWWHRRKIFSDESAGEGRRTVRYRLHDGEDETEEMLNRVTAIGAEYITSDSVGERVRIYSIKLMKEEKITE